MDSSDHDHIPDGRQCWMWSCIRRRVRTRSLSRQSGESGAVVCALEQSESRVRSWRQKAPPRLGIQFIHSFFLPSFMSFAKRPGNQSTDLLMSQVKRSQDGKSSLDVTDDLEHATSLSYTSHLPLNRNPAQSAPQHGDSPSQTQDDREGYSPKVNFDSNSQSQRPQHSSRNSSWDLLGGARKFGQAYEHFDPRNASEEHLVFADGDLPNSKVTHHRFF